MASLQRGESRLLGAVACVGAAILLYVLLLLADLLDVVAEILPGGPLF